MEDDTFRANVTTNDGRLVIDSVGQLDDKHKELGMRVIRKFCSKAFKLQSSPTWNTNDLACIIQSIFVGIRNE